MLGPIKISDSSRLQRKGRVGRSAPGTVYYMYPKGGRDGIKSKYKISIANFSEHFTNLLTLNTVKSQRIIDPNTFLKILMLSKNIQDDPNTIKNMNQLEQLVYNQYKIYINLNEGSRYNINNVTGLKKLYPNGSTLNYKSIMTNIIKWLLPSFNSGYLLKNVMDISGHFYLIHPLEQYFKRDIYTGKENARNQIKVKPLKID